MAEPRKHTPAEAGQLGAAKRLAECSGAEIAAPAFAALQRRRAVEQLIDPHHLLSTRERQQAARLHIEIEDRQQKLAAFAAGIIQRHQEELGAKQAELQRLTALVAA